jgi:hypothetical protein
MVGAGYRPLYARPQCRCPENVNSVGRSSSSYTPSAFGSSSGGLRKVSSTQRPSWRVLERAQTRHVLADGRPTFTNRLILETSPYLLQHAHNPVDWHPWGDEAFERARP